MTTQEAVALAEILEIIECGRIEEGTRILRTLISESGHRPPPMKLIAAHERRPRGSER